MSRFKRLIVEIHHRSLWQVLLIYVGGALVAYQAVQALTEGLGLPQWFPGLAVMLFIIGLPIVVATAFVHEAPAREATEHGPAPDEGIVQPPAEPLLRRHAHRRITWRNAGMAFVFALAIWGVVATVWMVFNPRNVVVDEAIADEADPGIAVLPFTARGEGMEVWREGMVDLLSTNLDGVPGLRSIDSRTVFARWRESVPETGEADRSTEIAIARATGAKYALLGSVVSLSGELRLAADIYELESGSRMGQVQVRGSPDSILSLVDRLAVQSLVVALQQMESDLPEIDVASVTTSSLPALRAWLEGEDHYRHGSVNAAVAAYERALAHDSTFAFAYYRLSAAYFWAESVSSDRAELAIEQAMRFVDRLPPRQAALVRGIDARERGERREAARILERLVRSYPDYADAWYELGEFYYHWGTAIPVSLDDARRCFSRAAELDPSFATYRIHLIDMAFKHDPDSARVAELLADYRQLSSADALQTRELEVAFDLAFGDEPRRRRTLAGLDTLDLQVLAMLPANRLLHPRFWREREAVHLALGKRRNRPYSGSLFWTAAGGRGQAESGFEYLDRPEVPVEVRACHALGWQQAGFPVSAERLAEADILMSQIDSLESSWLLYCAGTRAADKGLWEKHARAIETLKEIERRSVAAGGTGRTARGRALAAEAYGLWKQEQPEAALAVLDEMRRYNATNMIRWILPNILMHLERWDEAIPYLRSWWWDTYSFMNYNLARAYEQTGEYEKARKEYAFFVEAWQDADPELQPWVEDARRALERLTGDR
jgi:tetratricopeptide (TPR) repeat protein/TolB-like protein